MEKKYKSLNSIKACAMGTFYCPTEFVGEIINIIHWILPFVECERIFSGYRTYPRFVLGSSSDVTLSILDFFISNYDTKKSNFHIEEGSHSGIFKERENSLILQYILLYTDGLKTVSSRSQNSLRNDMVFANNVVESDAYGRVPSNEELWEICDYIIFIVRSFQMYGRYEYTHHLYGKFNTNNVHISIQDVFRCGTDFYSATVHELVAIGNKIQSLAIDDLAYLKEKDIVSFMIQSMLKKSFIDIDDSDTIHGMSNK